MSAAEITQPLALDDIFVIHELLIETFGGMRGVNEFGFGKLEAALAAPDLSMFGEDLYVGLAAKVSALFYGLVRAHGFSDGNKRVALIGLICYLQHNGARLCADEEALFAFTMAAASDWNQAQVLRWIEDHLESTTD